MKNGSQPQMQFDAKTKLDLKEAIKERFEGVYKDDPDGFHHRIEHILNSASYDEGTAGENFSLFNQKSNKVQEQVIDELWYDRERYNREIGE